MPLTFRKRENDKCLHLAGAKVRIKPRDKYFQDGIKMKLPGGLDLNSMMQQAQQMQEKMGREMKEMVVDAAAGGGAVTVKMRGDFEVVNLTISPDLIRDGDVEMIQDLTVAALNEARRKVEESLKGKLGGMLPPGLM
jgi:DNA-binding YbaB/EbfC family protein